MEKLLKLLSIEQVSEITGVSVGTLYHWVSQKRIPVVRFSSRCIRFRLSDIEAWLSEKIIAPEGTRGSRSNESGCGVAQNRERDDTKGSPTKSHEIRFIRAT
jgi:excisionase family DNA binding protein